MSFFSVLIREVERCNVICGIIICINASAKSYLSISDDCFLFFRARESEDVAIKDIVATYEQASKQVINLQKSEIFCSINTSVELRATMAQILGVKQVLHTCKYLGFLSMRGRSNKATFEYIYKINYGIESVLGAISVCLRRVRRF